MVRLGKQDAHAQASVFPRGFPCVSVEIHMTSSHMRESTFSLLSRNAEIVNKQHWTLVSPFMQ